MDKIRDMWAEYDPEGTYFIHIKHLMSFLEKIGAPFGITEEHKTLKSRVSFLHSLDLPTYNNLSMFFYYDVLQSLI